MLAVITFLAVMLVVFDPVSHRERLFAPRPPPPHSKSDELAATPEMIAEAARRLQREKASIIESGGESDWQAQVSYLVELTDGGSITARSVTIQPDSVTIVSDRGLTTVIPRTRVSKLYRLASPTPPTDQ